ncbi:hypothetical protein HQQ94_17885 [Shewanella sp. VB17]|uniref:hypothetical protein n=1 Tax=Shewanella sp. VB17 TaxID=2739432 RepID=UPI00156700A6|nr:hypothetical protein [Shewanella sp. VB17]NRD75052.1 hypothetical protein [Shewanella sp. VB17]
MNHIIPSLEETIELQKGEVKIIFSAQVFFPEQDQELWRSHVIFKGHRNYESHTPSDSRYQSFILALGTIKYLFEEALDEGWRFPPEAQRKISDQQKMASPPTDEALYIDVMFGFGEKSHAFYSNLDYFPQHNQIETDT